jgi:threonine aldolase
MAFSQALLRRTVTFRYRTQSAGFSNRRLFQQSILRFQSIQAAVAPRPNPEADAHVDHLDDVFELLQTKQIAWSNPGPAQFDFRSWSLHLIPSLPASRSVSQQGSGILYLKCRFRLLIAATGDVVTSPNLAMLRAIIDTTLLDDVYREDPTTISLEKQMASITGHEAALFVLSGTMANQVALRTHLGAPPHAILCDARSHIVHWEAGGLGLSGAMIQSVPPSNREFLTLEDIQRKAELSDDVHKCPTAVISLENTISGLVHPLSEIERISTWARTNGLKLHLDGARLWEVVAADAGSLRDYAQYFDSVALDFSKGLGAPMGAIIVGNCRFVKQARRIRKGMGGGMRQCGVLSGPARAAVNDFLGTTTLGGERGTMGEKLRMSHDIAKRVADMWVRKGGKLKRRTETNLVWVDLNHAGDSKDRFIGIGRRCGVKLDGTRIVLHYQISEEALRRLALVFDMVLAGR